MLPVRQQDTGYDLATRSPFAELDRLARELLSWTSPWQVVPHGFQIALGDLEETDDAFVLELDLPGVDKSDVDIELQGRRLTVTAERKERERAGILRRRTRTIGTYRHELVLPAEVDADRVEAQLTSGVLTVRLPKVAAAERRRIRVA